MAEPTTEDPRTRLSRLGLAGFLLLAGVMHFVNPRFFDELVPAWVPGSPRFWTYSSGAAEISAGALVANRSTSRLGAWAALAVFIGVYPANIWDSIQHPPTDARGIGSLIRLPLQIPMFLWAIKHTKE